MKSLYAPASVVLLVLAVATACSDGRPTTFPTAVPTSSSDPTPPSAPQEPPVSPPSGGQTVSIVAVGDTGMCSARDSVQRTADLAARYGGPLLLLGDLAYDRGTSDEFMNCFDPAWGKLRGRWHPLPGNHDYGTPNAAGYLQYFGAAAAPHGRIYYSVRIGEWLVLMLDSNEQWRAGSPQYEFVRSELAGNRGTCTLAAWHHPLFSSGPNGSNPHMRDLAALLHQNGADIILSGHDHLYERFARQTADGRPDAQGFRQFIAGTGGVRLYAAARREANSEVVVSSHGVLRLTLHANSYDWAFVDNSGDVIDAGADKCL
jgi:hypothetical protein